MLKISYDMFSKRSKKFEITELNIGWNTNAIHCVNKLFL